MCAESKVIIVNYTQHGFKSSGYRLRATPHTAKTRGTSFKPEPLCERTFPLGVVMRGKWLPCPFCGKELLEFGRGIRNGNVVEQRIHPRSSTCALGFGIVIDKKRWQRRAKQGEGKVPSHNTGSLKLLAELNEWVSRSASMYVYPNSDLGRRVREQLQAGA